MQNKSRLFYAVSGGCPDSQCAIQGNSRNLSQEFYTGSILCYY
ncbi:hypothetical protein B4098_2250 [Heyndrickxia coagulans]|uniref:Uncharacterized protein n=1 Tax=Heyndrickxia coagulans TaxID=1398 RepID=A0A150KBH1_HEYCO|nr:hypothetical protein B4098_2250 [Heyndrickxia coagulans]